MVKNNFKNMVKNKGDNNEKTKIMILWLSVKSF